MIIFLKRNWALIILILVSIFWIKVNFINTNTSRSFNKNVTSSIVKETDYMPESSLDTVSSSFDYTSNNIAPSEITDRLIIQDTSLSLQVKDVAQTIDEIDKVTQSLGGFLINSNLTKPEGAASGYISVRIPEEKRKDAMNSFKNMAVKVVSESIYGNDVTDQYMDLDARLEVLYKTKTKYEDILQKAEEVKDLMYVQQQLTNLQTQIDNLKGKQQYYEQSAKLSKIVIYISTDELALPYAPTDEWRPAVIFKEAVRSLVGTFREIGSLIIWGVVYLPIFIPIFLIIWFVRQKRQQKFGKN